MTARLRPSRAIVSALIAVLLAVPLAASLPAGAFAQSTSKKSASTKRATPSRKPASRAASKAPATPANVSVTILYTTDLHGHLLPWDYSTGTLDPELGLSKVAALVRKTRAEVGAERTLLVDAGDCIQGTPLAYVHNVGGIARNPASDGSPDPQMACMNAMGYDAFTVGNHEYNFGLDVLERARKDARFPWLSANTLRTEPSGAAAYQAYVVKEIEGVRIGILGLTTPGVPTWDDPKNYAGLTFEDPLETARRMVPVLRGMEHCDAVVLVCHMGLEEEDSGRVRPGQAPNENRVLAIARGVPGVDAILMGHTHVRVESRTENGVLLSQPGRWGEALGRMDLRFERNAGGRGYRLAAKTARLLDVDAAVFEDPEVAAIARPYHNATEALLSTVIAEATDSLAGDDARVRDNPLHELIHRAQLDAVNADVSLSAMFNPRARIPKGPVTVRDAFELYPYENTLAVLEIRGQDLKDALEHSSRYYNTYDFGRTGAPFVNRSVPGYNFDTAEGVSYVLDVTRPVGERIRNLRFHGSSLAMDRTLRLAVNNYRVNGGGGYDMLKRGREISRTTTRTRDLLVDYLKKVRKIGPDVDDNWRLVPAWGGEPERAPLELLVRRGVVPADSALAYGPNAPLTRGRYFRWIAEVAADPQAMVKDPWAGWSPRVLAGQAASRTGKRAKPGMEDPLDLELALVWSLRALPPPVRRASPRSAGELSTFRELGLAGPGAAASLAAPVADEARRFDLLADLRDGADPSRMTVGDGAAVLAATVFPRLTFLQISDLHGALLPGTKDRTTGRDVGGAPALAGWIARERAKNPRGTMLLDGGDWMQGTPISNLRFGRPVIGLMNRLGMDAAAIGNHEFDWTVDTLWARMREARFQPLGANWFDRASARRLAGVAPWTVLERRGLGVGVIGLLTTLTPQVTMPQNVAAFTFPDAAGVANALMDSVRAAGAHVVVLVGHLPGRQDSTGKVTGEIAETARDARGEDLVLGGHSHNRVSGTVDGTPVMIPGAYGGTLGRVDLVVDRRSQRVVREETRSELLTTFADEIRPSPATRAIAAFVDSANADILPITSRVVGEAAAPLGRSRERDSALGNWIADVMQRAVGADFAFQNPGGIRTDLAAGPVTVGEVYEIMPFDNQVVTVYLTGAQVLEVLETGVSPTTCVQVSGLSFSFDPNRPRGERVLDVTLPGGVRLVPGKTYFVATNDFMAQGGDGYRVFAEGKDLKNAGLLVRDLMVKDVERLAAAKQKLAPPPAGRIVNRGMTSAAAAAPSAAP